MDEEHFNIQCFQEKTPLSTPMSDNTRLIGQMVEHYMGIVNTTIIDMTPKYISKELVKEVYLIT